jgi:hypothetical protein
MLQTNIRDHSGQAGGRLSSRKNLSGASRIAAAMIALTVGCSAQLVLQPGEALSKDAKVYSFLPAMNLQSNLGVVGNGTAHSFKSLLQFDLTTIPIEPGQITLATLQLYCSAITPINDSSTPPAPIPGSGPGPVSLFAVTGAWTETGVTWDTFPSIAPSAVDTELIDTAGQWYTFDVTSLVQDWHNGTLANNGFAILMDNPMGQITLLDADGLTGASPDPTLAPKLTVVPEPGAAILGIAGLLVFGTRRVRNRQA